MVGEYYLTFASFPAPVVSRFHLPLTLLDMAGGLSAPPFFQRPNSQKNLCAAEAIFCCPTMNSHRLKS
jgi:hypothetical protein